MNQAAPIKVSVALVGVLAVLGLAASCGSQTVGNAAPRPSSASSSASHDAADVPNNGAPKVHHPLAVGAFRARPCKVLTPQQLNDLDLNAKGEVDSDNTNGPTCNWDDIGGVTDGSYGVTFFNGADGLSGPYSNKETGFLKKIEPVGGYPAVISMLSDSRAQGDCVIAVGLSDRQMISIGAQMTKDAPNYDNPCGVAAKLAEKVVETVKGRQ